MTLSLPVFDSAANRGRSTTGTPVGPGWAVIVDQPIFLPPLPSYFADRSGVAAFFSGPKSVVRCSGLSLGNGPSALKFEAWRVVSWRLARYARRSAAS